MSKQIARQVACNLQYVSQSVSHLPHAEAKVSVLGLEFAVVGLDEHALVAARRLASVQTLLVVQLILRRDDALGRSAAAGAGFNRKIFGLNFLLKSKAILH